MYVVAHSNVLYMYRSWGRK